MRWNKLSIENNPIKLTGHKVNGVVLFADLRGFSQYTLNAKPADVASLVQVIYERVIQTGNDYQINFHKFLGDGFMVVWERSADRVVNLAVEAAFEIHKKYWYYQKENNAAPEGFGIGITAGAIFKVQPETFIREFNELDYVGYKVNFAARLQSSAGAYQVLSDETVATNLDTDIFISEKCPVKCLKGVRNEDSDKIFAIRYPAMEKLWVNDLVNCEGKVSSL